MLPALPAIGDALGVASANGRQYVISAYLLGVGFGSLVYGPLSDRFGRKGVLVPALWAYMELAIGCGLSTSFPLLLALRFGHGLASAAVGVESGRASCREGVGREVEIAVVAGSLKKQ